MFLRILRCKRVIGATAEDFRTIWNINVDINYSSKRYAGHSQYANRKATKEESHNKRVVLTRKYLIDIQREIKISKNPNVATNSKLQAIFTEAMKNNIPKSTLENCVRAEQGILSGNNINTFVFGSPFGLISVVEINDEKSLNAKCKAIGVVKKFGFQFDDKTEVTATGIITCKYQENVENSLDKAIEDAISANCEEVTDVDGFLEFQCKPESLNQCSKQLEEIGYSVQHSETRYNFPKFINIEDKEISDMLEKMEGKLKTISGFVRVSYNIKCIEK